MGKVEYNKGDMHIALESSDEMLTEAFEKILSLVQMVPCDAPKEMKAKPKMAKPVKQVVEAKPVKQAKMAKPEQPKSDVGFVEHLDSFNKLSKPEKILAFAEWLGKPFKSKDFYAVENNKEERVNFHQRVASLRTANKLKNISKGVYQITDVGTKTLDKKRK
ncbi:MAG TPA: hypothetical protein ENN07_04750 [candidate division Zixibacteria bacterium]|nr:hypothetical protein [candidate division Zixibacteria bacterium]